ncbi:glycosyltransferase [Hymenobacter sp. BT186]|uniref:Glycosyltransferase n=1 Tax=Hymenobacter telluris TaxID=2816474 RepID=A0A939JCP3_9BACT|nr:glycosyltransferase [Hymenobacter telluris]MBW3373533.1 glycosyltransferase [Hymenobacter norwichensis]
MNLLHVVASLDPKAGGVCQAVRTMIAGLAARGVVSEVVSLDAPAATFLAADAFQTHALGPSRGPWAYSRLLSAWLTANVSRFDCIILHGLWLYPNYATHRVLHQLDAAGSQQVPRLFVMPHGMLDPYFQRASSRRLKAWRNWAYWKLIESHVVNGAAGMLFTCETERLLARQPFIPYHPQRELVIGLGVEEPTPYHPAMQQAFTAKCPGLHDRPYLLFISRIHDKKGVDLLLQAYGEASRSPSVSAQLPALVVAGPGLDTDYGRYIQQLATQLPPHMVYFPGMLEGDAKWGAFYGCEAFVLPSHQENFGIAVVEALACSVPVLISNQVNIWREIENARGGLVDDDTLAGTQRLLEKWCELSATDKQEMKANARAAYHAYFAVGPVAQKTACAL